MYLRRRLRLVWPTWGAEHAVTNAIGADKRLLGGERRMEGSASHVSEPRIIGVKLNGRF